MQDNKVSRVVELAAALTEKREPFKVGSVITWKEGLRNKKLDDSLVVTAVLSEPVLSSQEESGNPYFREPLDIKAAFLDRDGDLVEVHLDSRRFQLA